MRAKRVYRIAFLADFVVILAATIFSATQRPESGLAIGFIGYTNSPNGSPFALFGITNSTRHQIQRLHPGLEIEGGLSIRAPGFNPALPWVPRSPIKQGDFALFAIGVPTEQVKWRVRLMYQ